MADPATTTDLISGNQLLLLGLLGGLLASLRSYPYRIYHFIKSRFIITVEIQQNDPSFRWVLEWLHSHPSIGRSKTLALATKEEGHDDTPVADNLLSETLKFIYSPVGIHPLIYEKHFIWIERSRERQLNNGTFMGLYEQLRISAFTRSRKCIENLVEEAARFAKEHEVNKVLIYAPTRYGEWTRLGERTPRALNSVVLPDSVIEQTITDVKNFIANSEWYAKTGIPYRRGYLLYGPPGNGKTSLIFSIASELKKRLAVMNLAAGTLGDEDVLELVNKSPVNSILLIEDIDAAFNEREAKDGHKLTFSGLLNALDGVATAEGRILFLTTNYKEKLDSALVRPGRVDVMVEITPPQRTQIEQLYAKFFPEDTQGIKKVGDLVPEGTSAARLQEHFLRYKNSEDALRGIGEIGSD